MTKNDSLIERTAERVLGIYKAMANPGPEQVVQYRRALLPYLYELADAGETSSQRLVVAGLAFLRRSNQSRPVGQCRPHTPHDRP